MVGFVRRSPSPPRILVAPRPPSREVGRLDPRRVGTFCVARALGLGGPRRTWRSAAAKLPALAWAGLGGCGRSRLVPGAVLALESPGKGGLPQLLKVTSASSDGRSFRTVGHRRWKDSLETDIGGGGLRREGVWD